jgi:hypothetical protein
MQAYADWLLYLAWAYLSLSFLCGAIIIADEFLHPQKMAIMNLVWPITALYWGPVALWAYLKKGRMMTKEHQQQSRQGSEDELTPAQISLAVTHCGAGCTLGDIAAESSVAAFGLLFAGALFATRLVMDFLLAWFFGVIFQYFTIVPMRGLPPGKGILAAIRADTLSIVTFQIGLFGWMALVYYVIFPEPHLEPNEAVFWFMMQIGMIIGFFTSYPANVFLLRAGWKEKMG